MQLKLHYILLLYCLCYHHVNYEILPASSLSSFVNLLQIKMEFIDIGNMISPTIFACLSLCYLMDEMPQEALNDAMQAQVVSPIWHIASCLQAAALSALGMETEAQSALKKGILCLKPKGTLQLDTSDNQGSGTKSDTAQFCSQHI